MGDNGNYNNIMGEDNNYINGRNNIYYNLYNRAKKEKINCAKIMNNNGIKKNIINYINNFNTKTFQNDNDKKDNLLKIKSNNKKYIDYYSINNPNNNIYNNELLTKTKSSVNIGIKNNNVIIKHKGINGKNTLYEDIKNELEGRKDKSEGYYIKNNSSKNKNKKNLNKFKSINPDEDANNKTSSTNDYYVTYNFKNNELNEGNPQKMFYSLNNYNNTNKNILNLQYSKKNIKNHGIYGFKSQVLKNNLPKLVVDDVIIPFSENENENKNKIIGQKYMNDINSDFFNNNNYCNEKDFYNNIDNEINNNRIINTEIKQNNVNKNKAYTLEDISRNRNKINKSFSYSIENDEQNGNYNYNYNNNLQYQNRKSISPFYKRYKPSKFIITKEIVFPSAVNKNNSFYL